MQSVIERVEAGLEPACVRVCPMGAQVRPCERSAGSKGIQVCRQCCEGCAQGWQQESHVHTSVTAKSELEKRQQVGLQPLSQSKESFKGTREVHVGSVSGPRNGPHLRKKRGNVDHIFMLVVLGISWGCLSSPRLIRMKFAPRYTVNRNMETKNLPLVEKKSLTDFVGEDMNSEKPQANICQILREKPWTRTRADQPGVKG